MTSSHISQAGGPPPGFADARVGHAMHTGVISCVAETPLREVARILYDKHIHSLVVTGLGDSQSWGLISGLDLVNAAEADIDELIAADVAASEPVTVSALDPLSRATQLMLEHQVEHLIVIGAQDGEPIGVLSTLDVAAVMAGGGA